MRRAGRSSGRGTRGAQQQSLFFYDFLVRLFTQTRDLLVGLQPVASAREAESLSPAGEAAGVAGLGVSQAEFP